MRQKQWMRCVLALLFCAACSASARLDETEEQSKQRYGEPSKDSEPMLNSFPIIKGAVHHAYKYQGWMIECAFVDGKAVKIIYFKLGGKDVKSTIQDDELLAILAGESGAGKWQMKQKPKNNAPFQLMPGLNEIEFLNSNGNKALLEFGRSRVVLEAPAAAAFIKARDAAKEEQRKVNIPKF